MSNFRKFISLSAIAVLGVTNLLTPLSYASAAPEYDALIPSDLATHNLNFVMPDKDVYLYAHTEANHYFVEYSGTTKTSWTMPNGEFIYDQHGQHLSGNAYAKTWYTFSGWKNWSGEYIADKAEVYNWTTTESGTVPIYAQWNPNRYYITYDLNDSEGTSSWVHSQTPTSGLYDETLTILNPSRTWYIFSGWKITWMDSETHVISGVDYNGTTKDHESATSYKNLHASGGTVTFMANWDRDYVKYLVEYFKENLQEGTYTKVDDDTINTSGQADTEISPVVHTYTWFKSPDQVTTGIKADGTTYVRYDYERNSYTLTMNAGTWVDSVTAAGTVSTNVGPTETSATGSFKYDEPLTLTFVLSDWYENPKWSGYQDTASGFNMPAENISKTAYATPIVYTITYVYSGGTPADNPTSYTIESGEIVIPALHRPYSQFLWWSGWVIGGTTSLAQTVTIPHGSTWHRQYVAMWKCNDWYTMNAEGTQCIANKDTQYIVEHYLNDFEWNPVWNQNVTQTGETNTPTAARPLPYTWFEVASIETWNINWYDSTLSGMTHVSIVYNRLNYTGSVEETTWVTVTHVWENDGKNGATSGHHQYDDIVTIEATTWAGYTFSGWTITDADGHDITNQLLSGNEITSTTATFNMPASPVVIKANVKTNVYNITYELHDGNLTGGETNPDTYTVEDDFTLNEPVRDHSVFLWWSWTDITSAPKKPIRINDMIGDRSYEAIWDCVTWYHISGANECAPNQYSGNIYYEDGEHGAPEVIEFTYDQVTHLSNPEQSWYIFSGWIVTWMSGWVEHVLGTLTTTWDSASVNSGATTFMNLSTEQWFTDIKFTADWTPRDDTKYLVYHYYQNTGDNNYTLSGTAVEYSWTTDKPINLNNVMENTIGFHNHAGTWTSNAYTWWSVSGPDWAAKTEITIDKHGNTVVYFYYDRNMWNVYLSGDAHVATLTGYGEYKYGADVTVDMTAETWYHFKEWQKKTAEDNAGNTYLPNT